MKKWCFIFLFAMALVLSACVDDTNISDNAANDDKAKEKSEETNKDSSEGNTVNAEKAEEVFQNNCAKCHGSDLTGGAGPNLTEVGSRYAKEEIMEIIKNGKNNGRMPAGLITGDHVDLIAAWLAKKK